MEITSELRTSFQPTVEVTVIINALEQRKYTFVYNERDHALCFRGYMTVIRKTKRHKYEAVDIFGQWDRRQDTLTEAPKIPEAVIAEARKAFIDGLKILLPK